MKSLAFAVIAGLLLMGGCSRGVENQEAVRQAILDHLAKRANVSMGSMQIDVVAVSFRQNEADATVSFRPKGASKDAPGMTMNYTLERQGNRWTVKGRSDTAGSAHEAAGQMPATAPPSGHPAVGGQMPSGTQK